MNDDPNLLGNPNGDHHCSGHTSDGDSNPFTRGEPNMRTRHKGVGRSNPGIGVQEKVALEMRPEEIEEIVKRINPLWMLISCGYMVSWTSIGSLIAYFKARQGASFYVKLYCAFYLPGLPVSLLQQRYDAGWDLKLGSRNAFMLRIAGSFCFKIVLLLAMPLTPSFVPLSSVPNTMLLCMISIGIFSWLCHGTACQLVSMFPPSSTTFLQTGFRTPELYTVLMVWAFKLGADAPMASVVLFYYATAGIVAMGLVAFVVVCRSRPAEHYFALKDLSARSAHAKREAAAAAAAATANAGEDGGAAGERASLLLGAHAAAHAAEAGAVKEGAGCVAEEEPLEVVAQAIRPCRVAIFLNIWSSIFSAAFFAYVRPANPKLDVEMVLYFVRLFSDLVGRPLARLPRPAMVGDKTKLVRCAALRLVLLVMFFTYLTLQSKTDALSSDTFVVILIGVFSVMSGYLAVLSYEYAAGSLRTKGGQAMAGTLMNSTFQTAAFTAVIMGVLVAEAGWFKDPSMGGDEQWTDDFFSNGGDLEPRKSSADDDDAAEELRDEQDTWARGPDAAEPAESLPPWLPW